MEGGSRRVCSSAGARAEGLGTCPTIYTDRAHPANHCARSGFSCTRSALRFDLVQLQPAQRVTERADWFGRGVRR